MVGVRGPFGTSWGLDAAIGHDLVIVAGGVGLAPLRPVLLGALAGRGRLRPGRAGGGRPQPGRVPVPRRSSASGPPRRALEVELTVDQPAAGWRGPVGFVTEPLARLRLDPQRTTAFLCGPEPMMRFAPGCCCARGSRPAASGVSLERNMQCGIGLCGHCQLGPLLVCRDGPVVAYADGRPLLTVREL